MADETDPVGQEDIDALLREAQQAGGVKPPDGSQPAANDADQSAQQAASSPPSGDAVGQSEIDQLLQQASSTPAVAEATAPAASAQSDDATISQGDIDVLLNKAEQALASIDDQQDKLPDGVRPFEFHDFSGASANKEAATLDLMRDVQLDLTIELGRTNMQLENVLQLRKGAVVALDKLAGDPADIYVNGRLIARGEVLVLNDNFCVRVAELVASDLVDNDS